jgi:saccharopine dehydrogenase (NADP+, L-glutamate forming)
MLIMALVGFLSDEENSALKEPIPWKEATQKILGASNDSEKDLSWAIAGKASFKDNEQKEQLMAGLRWIGVVSNSAHLHTFLPNLHNPCLWMSALQTHMYLT